MPSIVFPEDLPVSQHRREIMDAVAANAVTIVAGDTGSGKTTQLPKMMLALGRGAGGRRIAVTQPRRLAAVTMSERVAEELGAEVGGLVGYRHRYAKRLSDETLVEFMTDGVLLAETKYDPLLRAYDTIIVDEAHERSLNIDFLLGILKRILARRRDLKLVIASATMDTKKFAAFFSAPVIDVPGRLFPVEIRYRPPQEDTDGPHAIAAAIAELPAEFDTLVFLAGERDIRETAELLASVRPQDEIIPLLASLPAAEQRRAFRLAPRRRIVLATNVAETSVTIPGIRAVVDTGVARIARYVHKTQVQRLQIERVSQASARQRAGRCGRIGPGICIRLFDEEDFAAREEYTAPEILRASLAGVILTMLDLRLGAIEDFPFVDPPRPAMVHEGIRELLELGAIRRNTPPCGRGLQAASPSQDKAIVLTKVGHQLARVPVEPRLARMLLAASDFAVLADVLPVVAAMACDDPKRRPIDQKEAAAQAHAKWRVQGSDFLGTLALWNWWQRETKDLSQSKSRKLAQKNFISYPKMREWSELARQLDRLAQRIGLYRGDGTRPVDRVYDDETRAAAFHRALLTGLLGRLGHYNDEERVYRGTHQVSFVPHPSSVLAKRPHRTSDQPDSRQAERPKGFRPPEWIMAGELVDTARLFAREAAIVDPRWIEPAARDLCRHHVHSPEWNPLDGFVRATEQVTLYGLVVVPARRVNYARFAPEEAREIFLRHALVYGDFPRPTPLLRETLAFLKRLRDFAAKTRRAELFDEDRILAHFHAAIPPDISDANALRKWLQGADEEARRRFMMRREDWWPKDEGTNRSFPDTIRLGDVAARLTYVNAPDDPERDGLTCTIRKCDAGALVLWRDDWLVPGMLREKVAYLVNTLPNSIRRLLVPAEDCITILMDLLQPGRVPLTEAVRAAIWERWAFRIPENAWEKIKIPKHLQVRFVITDDRQQRTLAATRDKSAALAAAGIAAESGAARTRQGGAVRLAEAAPDALWPFGTIAETVRDSGTGFEASPALALEDGTVRVKLFANAAAATTSHEAALLALFDAALGRERAFNASPLKKTTIAHLKATASPACVLLDPEAITAFLHEIRLGAIRSCLLKDAAAIRSREAFEKALAERTRETLVAEQTRRRLIEEFLADVEALYAKLGSGIYPEAAADDVVEQLAFLTVRGFAATISDTNLSRLPRYLKAIDLRLERARNGPSTDRAKAARFAPYWQRYRNMLARRNTVDAGTLTAYRWLLEEFRIALFAPELKTHERVSEKRLDELCP